MLATPTPPVSRATFPPYVRMRIVRRLIWLCLFCFLLCTVCFLFRTSLLACVARAWVIDDPLQKADAIVILGGRPDLRAVEAARLFHEGLAPHILYMDVKLGPSAELGIVPSEREQTHRLLLSNNVPETALEVIGESVSNTYDESRAVQTWVNKTGAHSILIPTDISHTRRARWIFRRELRNRGLQIYIRAIQPKEYSTADWWRHEEGLIAFQNEWIKSIYYCCKY